MSSMPTGAIGKHLALVMATSAINYINIVKKNVNHVLFVKHFRMVRRAIMKKS